MKINIWKNQKEIEKTYEVATYDLMYGTLQDIFEIIDQVKDLNSETEMLKVITSNRKTLDLLLLDIFPDMQAEELKKIKVKEMMPLMRETLNFVLETFGKKKN